MHIGINDNTLLRNIQEVFANYYPYLKLEFYRAPHRKYEASDETDRLDPGASIGSIKKTHVSGMLEMQPVHKVAEVEREFLQRFGLSVQVFRKEKKGWEQSTGTDNFTLKDLNEMGRLSQDEVIITEYEEGFTENSDKPEKLL